MSNDIKPHGTPPRFLFVGDLVYLKNGTVARVFFKTSPPGDLVFMRRVDAPLSDTSAITIVRQSEPEPEPDHVVERDEKEGEKCQNTK